VDQGGANRIIIPVMLALVEGIGGGAAGERGDAFSTPQTDMQTPELTLATGFRSVTMLIFTLAKFRTRDSTHQMGHESPPGLPKRGWTLIRTGCPMPAAHFHFALPSNWTLSTCKPKRIGGEMDRRWMTYGVDRTVTVLSQPVTPQLNVKDPRRPTWTAHGFPTMDMIL
jgi:hypothetical protein